ncbi:hypothetical protein EVAR_46079_1 [Eumeta japonica]|uniref:Mos1 transposase HTH domain-containing protein n=1 Tax=Eumeta variegata TaxID=151549 RepID=A0A4C2A2J9_EUMVA|nr:hypothetical protein EVAR_46079_1 [Eumeta japonica]
MQSTRRRRVAAPRQQRRVRTVDGLAAQSPLTRDKHTQCLYAGALHRNISLAQLQSAFGDEAPCKMFIYNWFAEFKRAVVNFSDEFRDGHPYTVNNKNIDSMRRMIETDKHVTYHGI